VSTHHFLGVDKIKNYKGVVAARNSHTTPLLINNWTTYLAIICAQTDSGNATNASLILIRTGYSGNNIATHTICRLRGEYTKVLDKDYCTFTASENGYLVINAEAANMRYCILY